jgi:hypothetical protein
VVLSLSIRKVIVAMNALTPKEYEERVEKLGRPVNWPCCHQHSSSEALKVQTMSGSDGSNKVEAKRLSS